MKIFIYFDNPKEIRKSKVNFSNHNVNFTMRLSRIIVTAIPFVAGITQAFASTPNSDVYQVRSNEKRSLDNIYDDIVKITSSVEKRSDSSIEMIEGILKKVNNSGIITDLIDEIANSKDQQNTLVYLATNFIKNGGGKIKGININFNISEVLDSVIKSGIINSTLDGLLLDTDNRAILADRTGHVLSKYAYTSKILYDLGDGKKLTVENIADTVRHYKTKNPKYQYLNQGKQTILSARADQYSGSAKTFFNNIANTILQSELVGQSTDDFMIALNRSGIVPSIAMSLVKDTKAVEMLTYIIGKLYDNGSFDNLDLNKYFEKAKKKNILSDGAQMVLTDPTYSPPLADIFKRMENNGVFKDVELNLWGPN